VVPGVYPGEPDFQTLTGTGTNPGTKTHKSLDFGT
jgi:hypothetical protein